MAQTNLVFEFAPLANPAELIFGDTPVSPPRDVYIAATFPLQLQARIGPRIDVTVSATFPLSLSAVLDYDTNVSRPTVGTTLAAHQVAIKAPVGVEDRSRSPRKTPVGWTTGFDPGIFTDSPSRTGFLQALRLASQGPRVTHQDAVRVGTQTLRSSYKDALRDRRSKVTTEFREAIDVRTRLWTDWQERFRDRRPQRLSRFQEARPLRVARAQSFTTAKRSHLSRTSRYQEAIRPPAGISAIIVPPGPEPCYLPDPNLVFYEPFGVYNNLVFVCDGEIIEESTVVVPVRSVYVVINNISLRRVVGNTTLPTFGMSLSIDVDSWTWGFSASLPISELDAVMPDSSGPVELEANINGTLYRVLAENISRERAFGSDAVRVGGRGKSALLASPYSPLRSFSNSISRTAQQLMADVLTFNGVSIGWDVDWQLTDWLVPAGAFNTQGSYIDGLISIAGAAGAYLQPHPTLQEMSVLHRYPTAPWDWGTVMPDFELPAAVTVRESVEWVEKPAYNRVYVSGTSQGVLARVTRTGTAGDLNAQMVTDPLITAANAGRQRGLAVLGDTGRQAMVTLRLPVLAETGVITPGKFVRYVEGLDERLGIVRSTNVEAGFPQVFQTIRLETHIG